MPQSNIDPLSPTVGYSNLGVFQIMGEQYDKAIESFSKAIELNPEHAAAYTHRGCAYAMTGELDKALIDHNKAIALDPEFSLCLLQSRHNTAQER